eukprot:scaffold79741_cov50-Phaeocystis_antarctica.AAC.4
MHRHPPAGRRIMWAGRIRFGRAKNAHLAARSRALVAGKQNLLLAVTDSVKYAGGQRHVHRGCVGQLYLPDGRRAPVARGAADHRAPHLPALALRRRRARVRHVHERDRGDHLDAEDGADEGRLDEAGRRVEPHRREPLSHGPRLLRAGDPALVRRALHVRGCAETYAPGPPYAHDGAYCTTRTRLLHAARTRGTGQLAPGPHALYVSSRASSSSREIAGSNMVAALGATAPHWPA